MDLSNPLAMPSFISFGKREAELLWYVKVRMNIRT